MICRRTICRSFLIAGMVLSVCEWALADDCPSGSDGSDGALDCAALGCPPGCDESNPCMVEIDLSQALTGAWDTQIPKESQGVGIYDSQQWALVFKYTTINIPAGVTVTFKNHASRAPVFWLASGDVIVEGDPIVTRVSQTLSQLRIPGQTSDRVQQLPLVFGLDADPGSGSLHEFSGESLDSEHDGFSHGAGLEDLRR